MRVNMKGHQTNKVLMCSAEGAWTLKFHLIVKQPCNSDVLLSAGAQSHKRHCVQSLYWSGVPSS